LILRSPPSLGVIYLHQVALELFETDWAELIGTPSSVSAEPTAQPDRSSALSAALENGYVNGYEGWRKSFKGTRFKIMDATVFNVEAPSGSR
jgi:hypothetical protein